MAANIITGYTGERHITPAMDAAVYRSMVGADSYVLEEGNLCSGTMPSINRFTVMDGLVALQGHMIQIMQETLTVDTCATGYKRIDLICVRFTHDNSSLVDAAQLVVIKGTEVQSGNTPVEPAHNTGVIDEGASIVDMPLYRIDLSGSTVTFTSLASVVGSEVVVLEVPSFSTLPQTVSDRRITGDMVVVNSVLSNPSAQTGDWEVTTSNGSLTITGTMSGSTDLTLYLQRSR